MQQLAVLIYLKKQNRGYTWRELAEGAGIPIWKLNDMLALTKGLTIKKIHNYALLLGQFERVMDQPGSLDWLLSRWR